MSLGTYDPERRYRRRSAERRRNIFMLLFLFILISGLSYWAGKISIRSAAEAARNLAQSAGEERDSLLSEVTTLRARMRECDAVSTQNHLDAIPAGQLQAIGATQKSARECLPKETAQLLLGTSGHAGQANTISFSGGLLSVGGSGEAAVDENGKVLSWFDPRKPVKMRFSVQDSDSVEKSALLPFTQSIISDGREYTLSVAVAAQSFVEVSVESCQAP